MSTLPNMQNQRVRDLTFDASGTITTGGTAQLVLPERNSTTMLLIQNISSGNLLFEFGSARATATLTGTKVSSVTVTNNGFNFTLAPEIEFLGGGRPYNTVMVPPAGVGAAGGYDAPTHPAQAHCVMTTASAGGNQVNSITLDDGGTGYYSAPYVWIKNRRDDPSGCALPSSTSGILLVPYGSLCINDVTNPTDPISVYGATTGQAFTVKWRP
jgi:hypothetical protein